MVSNCRKFQVSAVNSKNTTDHRTLLDFQVHLGCILHAVSNNKVAKKVSYLKNGVQESDEILRRHSLVI